MRVAVIIDSLKLGGAQKLVATFAVSASIQRIETTVISLSDQNAKAIFEVIEAAGVHVVQFPARSLKDLQRLWRLTRFISNEKFDLIHTHLSHANILGSLVGFFTRTPVVATLHSTGDDPNQQSFMVQIIENICLRYFVTRIIVVGYSVMDAHANRNGGRQVEIIPNAVPIQEPVSNEIRAIVRREIVGDSTRRIVITVGRFVHAKGYEDMIDAFVSIHRKHPEAVLVMVGSGILFPKIKMKVYDLQLTDSVYLLGERKDTSRLLAAGDVYASSSNREGLPVAVLEAMMAGLPVVGTNVGDMAKVVTDEIGRIVPPHHPELLAEAIDELLNAPEKIPLMGKAARLSDMQEYSVELWMARHAALYKEILNSKGHLTPI